MPQDEKNAIDHVLHEGGRRLAETSGTPSPRPQISIITSTFNAAAHLPSVIESIRAQKCGKFEWIIIDGASKDGTLNLLRGNEDIIDYWLSEPDSGIYAAWNKGVRHARGEWIFFLGADDYLWSPDTLEKASCKLSRAFPEYRVVYGKVALINQAGEGIYFPGEAWGELQQRFLSVMCLPHTALFHHRELFREHGDFDITFRISGDYEFLLRELKTRPALFVDDLIVAGMAIGGISSSPATSEKMLFEMRRATRKHGRLFPGAPWLLAALRHILRKTLWCLLGEKTARRLLDVGRRLMGKPAHWTRT